MRSNAARIQQYEQLRAELKSASHWANNTWGKGAVQSQEAEMAEFLTAYARQTAAFKAAEISPCITRTSQIYAY